MRAAVTIGVCAAIALPSSALLAEDTPDSAPVGIPTIVITPEWTAMDAQQVPKTVTSYSGVELDAVGIQDSVNLQYEVPGLVVKTNSILGQPYLRGVGSDLITFGAEASVATFIDGVYMPRDTHATQGLYDLDRVEIIKGPQGVHLGRNVVGGAISVHTLDPTPDHSAYADAQYGNYDRRQLRFAVNQPLYDTVIAVRLAGTMIERDGFTDNVFLGNTADDENYQALRGKLKFSPSDRFDLLISAEHGHEDSSRALGHHPDPVNGVNGGILLGGTVPDDPRQITHNTAPDQDVDTGRYMTRMTWRPAGLEFTSTTAYITENADIQLDLDATEVDFASNYPGMRTSSLSQEFRLASHDDEAYSWTGGLYLSKEDADEWVDVRFPLASASNRGEGSADTRSMSAFGQAIYRLSPDLRAKAGLRYTRDRRSVDITQTVSDPLGALGPAGMLVLQQREARDWEAATPEASLDYSPHDDRLYYVSAARGYKAGGYNLTAIQPAFDPEYLWAYELGAKTRLASRRVLLNVALFYYDYEDMQLLTPPAGAPTGTFPMVINAAESTIKGMDIEARYQPTWNSTLSFGATLLHARFDEFVSQDPNNPAADPDHAGDPLPHAPEISLNLAARYTWPLRSGELTLQGGYRYQSRMYFNVYNDPTVKEDAYGLFDASLSYEDHRGRWYGQLYGRNLTDELYAQSMIRQDPLIGILRWWGAPRTIGLRLGYRI